MSGEKLSFQTGSVGETGLAFFNVIRGERKPEDDAFILCKKGKPGDLDDHLRWEHDGKTEYLCADRAAVLLRPLGLWPVSGGQTGPDVASWAQVMERVQLWNQIDKEDSFFKKSLAMVADESSPASEKMMAMGWMEAKRNDGKSRDFTAPVLLPLLSHPQVALRGHAAYLLADTSLDPRVDDELATALNLFDNVNNAGARLEVIRQMGRRNAPLSEPGKNALQNIARREPAFSSGPADIARSQHVEAILTLLAHPGCMTPHERSVIAADAVKHLDDTILGGQKEWCELIRDRFAGKRDEAVETLLRAMLEKSGSRCGSEVTYTAAMEALFSIDRKLHVAAVSRLLMDESGDRNPQRDLGIATFLTREHERLGYEKVWDETRKQIAYALAWALVNKRGVINIGDVVRALGKNPHPCIREMLVKVLESSNSDNREWYETNITPAILRIDARFGRGKTEEPPVMSAL